MSSQHAKELSVGARFAFGENWSRFLEVLDDNRIRLAELSLCDMLEVTHLRGKTFLDIGSGSGLFSLTARRLGARVHSFDYDSQSVSCTAELRRRYFPDDPNWMVEGGSVLDTSYLQSLGQWDVVYSWGVLHHTGAMWQACENVVPLVAKEGRLFIAIYNDLGSASRRWLRVKQAYNSLPSGLRWLLLYPAFIRLWGPTIVRDLVMGRPFFTWKHYGDRSSRGMSPWRDLVDWVGGLPFEVARPEEIVDFYRDRGFVLRRMATCLGHGCNEFVFQAQRATDSVPTTARSLNDGR